MDRAQAVQHLSYRRREQIVGCVHSGKAGVATAIRQAVGLEQDPLGWQTVIGGICVPAVGTLTLRLGLIENHHFR